MLRIGTSALARRAILSSTKGTSTCAVQRAFHVSAPRDEEAAASVPAVESPKGGLFGTGLSEWFALPVGMTFAIPVIHFDWYVINEETQLAAVFIAFCVTVYTQGGEAIYKSLDEKAVALLKEHNESEDKVINALESQLEFLKNNTKQVEHFEAIHALRGAAYDKLNAAGAIKPQHEFKAQVEKMMDMIAAEEQSITNKTKTNLMAEATANVTQQFTSTKALKKAALDSAIATIKGGAVTDDPVKKAFVKFFKEKAISAKKSDDGSEAKASRAALLTKMNSIAKNEKFFFNYDADGTAKLSA